MGGWKKKVFWELGIIDTIILLIYVVGFLFFIFKLIIKY